MESWTGEQGARGRLRVVPWKERSEPRRQGSGGEMTRGTS